MIETCLSIFLAGRFEGFLVTLKGLKYFEEDGNWEDKGDFKDLKVRGLRFVRIGICGIFRKLVSYGRLLGKIPACQVMNIEHSLKSHLMLVFTLIFFFFLVIGYPQDIKIFKNQIFFSLNI